MKNEEILFNAIKNEYKNHDVNLLYEMNFLASSIHYSNKINEHELHRIEQIVNDIEASETFTHAVNSIGLWNLRLYEMQLYYSGKMSQFSRDELYTLSSILAEVGDTTLNIGNKPSVTILSFTLDIYKRVQEKLFIREELNTDELKTLLNQLCKTELIESQFIKDGCYGFTPERAIDLSCTDYPISSLLKFVHEYLNSAGIGIVYEKIIDNNTSLYTAELYHRPTHKKYIIYFLANPHKIETH